MEKLDLVRKWSINTYKVTVLPHLFFNTIIICVCPFSVLMLIIVHLVCEGVHGHKVSLPVQCTRQILSERLGRGSRTVDMELEAQIEILRDNKRKYQHVIKLAQTLAGQLSQIMQTQRQLGDAFADLSLKSPELHVSRVDGLLS